MLVRPPRPDDPRRKSASARQRRYRRRAKAGNAIFPIEADECAVIEAMLKSGRMTEAQALKRKLVNAALGELIAEWAGRWNA